MADGGIILVRIHDQRHQLLPLRVESVRERQRNLPLLEFYVVRQRQPSGLDAVDECLDALRRRIFRKAVQPQCRGEGYLLAVFDETTRGGQRGDGRLHRLLDQYGF